MQHLRDGESRTAAIDYMRRTLAQGHTLATFLLENVNLLQGTILVSAPDALYDAQLVEFEQSHFPQAPVTITFWGEPRAASPVLTSENQLADFISPQLARSAAGPVAKP